MLAMTFAPRDLRPSFVTVSGYPPVQAITALRNGHVLGIVTDSADLQRLHAVPEYRDTLRVGPRLQAHGHPLLGQCSGCNKPRPLDPTFPAYCTDCAPPLKAECLLRWGHLPGDGEFYCTTGRHIALAANRCKPDPTHGRQRRGCWECRKGQLRRAGARYRRRPH